MAKYQTENTVYLYTIAETIDKQTTNAKRSLPWAEGIVKIESPMANHNHHFRCSVAR
jgi:hypothetical protein